MKQNHMKNWLKIMNLGFTWVEGESLEDLENLKELEN